MSEKPPKFQCHRDIENSQNSSELKPTCDLCDKSVYRDNEELYQEHFKDQYLTYVEMADRISARRHLANVFFLGLQTTVITILATSFSKKVEIPAFVVLITLMAMMFVCVAWWYILISYRNLNSAKYKVIGRMEESLPASPYWKEEWSELGQGEDFKKYLPLSLIEQLLPVIFFLMYMALSYYLLMK